MITTIEGMMGSGKTAYAVVLGERALKRGETVWADFSAKNFQLLKVGEDLFQLKSSLFKRITVLIDSPMMFFGSGKQSRDPISVTSRLEWLRRIRYNKSVQVYLIGQRLDYMYGQAYGLAGVHLETSFSNGLVTVWTKPAVSEIVEVVEVSEVYSLYDSLEIRVPGDSPLSQIHGPV